MEKTNTITNEYTPIATTFSIKSKINWWVGQSCQDDKGGSFNLNLYLAYLEAQDDYLNPKKQEQ